MRITITDTSIALDDGAKTFQLLEKPVFPYFHHNVTKKPYISSYYETVETIWEHCQTDMELLADACHSSPYYTCYALLFHRLFPLLLSSSQVKNVIVYDPLTDCGAYRVFQKFMRFLEEDSALTALPQSPYAFTLLKEGSCHAFLYCLDALPSLPAVCDAISKVKPGGLILLYTIKDPLPAELEELCAMGEKDSFGSCTVYAFTVDETLSAFALENGSAHVICSRAEEVLKRTGDLQNLISSMLSDTPLPGDAYFIAVLILQQTEEILLSLYDYLEDDGLPVHANVLKESVLNYYVGISRQCDLTSYREKLTQSSELFFAAIEREFQ